MKLLGRTESDAVKNTSRSLCREDYEGVVLDRNPSPNRTRPVCTLGKHC